MNRRGFLWMLSGTALAEALEPVGRVYSFPSQIRIYNRPNYDEIARITNQLIVPKLSETLFMSEPIFYKLREVCEDGKVRVESTHVLAPLSRIRIIENKYLGPTQWMQMMPVTRRFPWDDIEPL